MARREPRIVLVLLLIAYLAGRIAQLFPERIPSLLIVALQVVPPALFALVDGSRTYRWRGILVFVLLSLSVGTPFEILSLRTGFPFGHDQFTALMGPKIFGLPVMLALAYVGMGYLSWVVAVAILKYQGQPLSGRRAVLLPVVAGLVMVAWDLSMDPVWANIDRAWIWRDGGRYFGVPLSNFLGWYLTVWVVYQSFALYLRNKAPVVRAAGDEGLAILFYVASAAGNLLITVPASVPRIIVDGSGRGWTLNGILWASRIVSVFLMLPLALAAWGRKPGTSGAPEIDH